MAYMDQDYINNGANYIFIPYGTDPATAQAMLNASGPPGQPKIPIYGGAPAPPPPPPPPPAAPPVTPPAETPTQTGVSSGNWARGAFGGPVETGTAGAGAPDLPTGPPPQLVEALNRMGFFQGSSPGTTAPEAPTAAPKLPGTGLGLAGGKVSTPPPLP